MDIELLSVDQGLHGHLINQQGKIAMLPPFIIEHIREREREMERRQQEEAQRIQPEQRLPPPPSAPDPARDDGETDEERGVVIIDLMEL